MILLRLIPLIWLAVCLGASRSNSPRKHKDEIGGTDLTPPNTPKTPNSKPKPKRKQEEFTHCCIFREKLAMKALGTSSDPACENDPTKDGLLYTQSQVNQMKLKEFCCTMSFDTSSQPGQSVKSGSLACSKKDEPWVPSAHFKPMIIGMDGSDSGLSDTERKDDLDSSQSKAKIVSIVKLSPPSSEQKKKSALPYELSKDKFSHCCVFRNAKDKETGKIPVGVKCENHASKTGNLYTQDQVNAMTNELFCCTDSFLATGNHDSFTTAYNCEKKEEPWRSFNEFKKAKKLSSKNAGSNIVDDKHVQVGGYSSDSEYSNSASSGNKKGSRQEMDAWKNEELSVGTSSDSDSDLSPRVKKEEGVALRKPYLVTGEEANVGHAKPGQTFGLDFSSTFCCVDIGELPQSCAEIAKSNSKNIELAGKIVSASKMMHLSKFGSYCCVPDDGKLEEEACTTAPENLSTAIESRKKASPVASSNGKIPKNNNINDKKSVNQVSKLKIGPISLKRSRSSEKKLGLDEIKQ